MADELHVGSTIHYFTIVSADDEHPEETPLCEAALVTAIQDREKGLVSLLIFPEGSQTKDALAVHGTTDETWHFLSECPTGA